MLLEANSHNLARGFVAAYQDELAILPPGRKRHPGCSLIDLNMELIANAEDHLDHVHLI